MVPLEGNGKMRGVNLSAACLNKQKPIVTKATEIKSNIASEFIFTCR